MSEPQPDVERYDSVRYDEWPIERETAAEGAEEDADREPVEDIEWVGMTVGPGEAFFYDPRETSLYRGEIDEENERIVLREGRRRELDSEESLGEHLEEIGEDHDWDWLSSFAREYLEADESEPQAAEELVLTDSEFDERNVGADDDHDVAFTGRHNFEDESGRVHMQEHWFYAFDEGDRVRVDVREDFLVAEAPRAEETSGDAEPVTRREHEFEVDVDTDSIGWEGVLRERLQEWHEEQMGWPDAAERGDESASLSGR